MCGEAVGRRQLWRIDGLLMLKRGVIWCRRLLSVATHQWRHHPSAVGGHGHCHLTFDDMHTCVVEACLSPSSSSMLRVLLRIALGLAAVQRRYLCRHLLPAAARVRARVRGVVRVVVVEIGGK
jgi:hypothetical protein